MRKLNSILNNTEEGPRTQRRKEEPSKYAKGGTSKHNTFVGQITGVNKLMDALDAVNESKRKKQEAKKDASKSAP